MSLIYDKHLYHGAALFQIVEDTNFINIKKLNIKYGLYEINGINRILIKHHNNKNNISRSFVFHFERDDLECIAKTRIECAQYGYGFYVCLVCIGNISKKKGTICMIDAGDLDKILDFSQSKQHVGVYIVKGGSMHVAGLLNKEKPICIHHDDFPNKLFEKKPG